MLVSSTNNVDVRSLISERTEARFRPIRVDFHLMINARLYQRKSNEHWNSEELKQEVTRIHEQANQSLQEIITDHLKWMEIVSEIDYMVDELFQEKQVVWPKI